MLKLVQMRLNSAEFLYSTSLSIVTTAPFYMPMAFTISGTFNLRSINSISYIVFYCFGWSNHKWACRKFGVTCAYATSTKFNYSLLIHWNWWSEISVVLSSLSLIWVTVSAIIKLDKHTKFIVFPFWSKLDGWLWMWIMLLCNFKDEKF